MNKTLKRALLCVAFVVCLIVAMIPIMSIRTNAEPASINFYINSAPRPVNRGATRCYTTDANGALTEISATSEDYNIKITYPEDDTPTMYLKGAYVKNLSNNENSLTADDIASKMTIVVEKTATGTVTVGSNTIQADSYIGTLLEWKGGDLVFEGRENSKLYVATSTKMIEQAVTYKNLNLEIATGTGFTGTPTLITFDGGTATINNTYLGTNLTVNDTVRGITVKGNAVVNWTSTNQVIYGNAKGANAKLRVESGNLTMRSTTTGKAINQNVFSEHNALEFIGGTVEFSTPATASVSLGFGMYSAANYRNPAGENVYNAVAGADAATATAHIGSSGFAYGVTYFRIEPAYTVSVTDGTADVAKAPAGATVTLTPGTVAGKVFDSWSSSDVTVANDNTFTMPAKNVAVTANFIKSAAVKLDGVEYTFTDTNSRYFTTNAAGEITEDGTVDAYNIKLAYNGDMPTVYLKNAFIAADADAIDNHTGNALTINVEAASRITHANAATNTEIENAGTGAAIKTAGNITITGSGLLTTESKNRSGNIIRVTSAFSSGTIVKFENANIEFNAPDSKAWNEEGFRGTPAKYVFDGGKVTINTGYLNILANGAATAVEIINDAEVNANSTGSGFIYAPSGSVVIDGGKLKIDGKNAISSLTKLEIKSGTMEAIVTTGNISALTPDLTAYTNAYAVLGASKAEATAYTGGALANKYFKVGIAYNVNITDGANQNTIKAFVGDTVTLTAGEAPAGQVLMGWNVTAGGATMNGSSFTMPANDVSVTASYGVAGGITIGANEYSVIKGGAAIYFKTDDNGVVTVAGDENDYNLKLVYADEEGAVPTLYLKGAKVDAAIKSNAFSAGTTKIVTETDSTVTGAITWSTGELVISGSGKLALTKTITATGAKLTVKDANVEQKTDAAVGFSGKDITFDGGKFLFESTKPFISDWSTAERTVLIKGNAKVTFNSTEDSALVLSNANASLIVDSGYLTLISTGTAATDGHGCALRVATDTKVKVNGGTVEIYGAKYAIYRSTTPVDLSNYTGAYVIQAAGNGGTGIVQEITDGVLTKGQNGVYVAKYVKISTGYTITVNGATANRTKASEGDEVTLETIVPVGKKFDSWTIDNGSASVTIENNKFTMPAGNVSITANYVDDPLYDGNPLEIGFWFAGYKQMVTRGETYYLITDASGVATATGATADNYNIKIEYEFGKAPVIYLRGAYLKGSYGAMINNNQSSGNLTDAQRADKVVIVVEKELGNAVSAVPTDVTADSYLVSYIFMSKGDLEIQGPGKLVVDKAVSGETTISGKIQAGGDLTFTNADVQVLYGALKGQDITFDGGKIDITSTGEVAISIWQNPYVVLVKNNAEVKIASTDKAAAHLVGTNATLQIDSGSLVLKSTAEGTNSENAALKIGSGGKLIMNGGSLELSGTVAVVTGNIEMTLNGTFYAICANNVDGTGAVAYKDTTIKQYNSSFQLKYFKIQPGTGSSDDDSGNTGTGTGTHKHSTTKVRGKAASCTADGVKEHYKCSCGKFFEDKAAKKEIKDIDTWKVIKATGHKDADKDGICDTCKKSAQTSDSSFTALWITLLTVSAMGMCVTFVYNKKKATK